MTTELILSILSGVLAAALVFQSLWHDRNQRVLIAQCDERVSMLHSVHEREKSRYFATLFPATHALYREKSGTIDGAKQSVKLHGESAGQIEMFEKKKEQAEDAIARAQVAKEELLAMHQKLRPEPVEVATQLGFENVNGAP